MTNIINKNKRKRLSITGKKRVIYIINKFLNNKKLYLKGYPRKVHVNIQHVYNDNLKVFLPFDYLIEKSLTLYAIAEKHIEIKFKYIDNIAIGRHIVEPINASIASSTRDQTRYTVNNKEVIISGVQQLSGLENYIFDPHSIPISVKNIFIDYERILSPFYSNISAGCFDADSLKEDKLLDIVFSKKKLLYLKYTREKESYFFDNENLINYGILLGTNLEKQMHYFSQEKINSILIYPVMYRRESKDIPLGYIKVYSPNDPIDIISTVAHLNFVSYEIMQKMQQIQTLINFDMEQEILDIGLGGLKFFLTNKKLDERLYVGSKLIFNIIFQLAKKTININLNGEIVEILKTHKKDQKKVCISFYGNEKTQLKTLKKTIKHWQSFKNKKSIGSFK